MRVRGPARLKHGVAAHASRLIGGMKIRSSVCGGGGAMRTLGWQNSRDFSSWSSALRLCQTARDAVRLLIPH